MSDRRPVLELVDGELDVVEVPGGIVLDDAEIEALGEDKHILTVVVDIFGPVKVEQVAGPRVWPPKGGFVPAWRRLLPGKPLIVLPSEHVAGQIDPFAIDPPSTPCPVCVEREPPAHVTPSDIAQTCLWLTCTRCGGHRFRPRADHDECAVCGPFPGVELPPATWYRAGSGWACGRCHPRVPPDTRAVCAICGGKGACRSDHDTRLRQLGERLLRRTRSVKKQEQIRAALAALPEGGRIQQP